MSENDVFSALKSLRLLRHMHDPDLADIAPAARLRSFGRQAVILRAAQAVDALTIIIKGRAKTVFLGRDGREVILDVYRSGEVLIESLAIDATLPDTQVLSLEPVTVLTIARQAWTAWLRARPDVALQLLGECVARLRRTRHTAASLALLDVHRRVARTLDQLAEPHGDERIVPTRLTHQEIASMVGASREMVSRTFKSLTQSGFIRVEAGRIVVRGALEPLDA